MKKTALAVMLALAGSATAQSNPTLVDEVREMVEGVGIEIYPLGYTSNPWFPVWRQDGVFMRQYIDPMYYTQEVADRYADELHALGCVNPSYPFQSEDGERVYVICK